jgi:hypothetical protein
MICRWRSSEGDVVNIKKKNVDTKFGLYWFYSVGAL